MIYFTSDLHLGHENVIKMCDRGFSSVGEMDDALVCNWNKRVGYDDTVYIVGDLVWQSCDPTVYLSRLNGHKILIVGNHDVKWLKRLGFLYTTPSGFIEFRGYSEYFDHIAQYVETVINGTKVTLCHYPMTEWQASRKIGSKKLGYHIHGHIHNSREQKYRSLFLLPHALNAGTDINGFMPVTFDELAANNEKFKLGALDRDTDRALYLASKYHLYQTDKAGKPYIEHPLAVAAKQSTDAARCVALLHDILEDTDIDVRVIDENFSSEVSAAVKLLTRDKNTDYFDYIRNVEKDKLAKQVKLADLEHNSDISRISAPTEADYLRLEKYKKALELLRDDGI